MDCPNIKRLYYSTSEVSRMTNVRPYIIRKWEKKFSFLNSIKKQSGRKFFKPNDLETVKKIKRLKEIGYTNEKIKKIIINGDQVISGDTFESNRCYSDRQLLQEIYRELIEILKILEKNTF